MSEKPSGWLSDRELADVAPAETVAFRSPVPTQIVSNGEFNPLPQTRFPANSIVPACRFQIPNQRLGNSSPTTRPAFPWFESYQAASASL